jgi:hypothetical protein
MGRAADTWRVVQVNQSQAVISEGEEGGVLPSTGGPLPRALATFLILVVVGGSLDLVLDKPASLWSFHVLFEAALVLLSLVFAVVLFRGWRRAAVELGAAKHSLAETQAVLEEQKREREAWRQRADEALTGSPAPNGT